MRVWIIVGILALITLSIADPTSSSSGSSSSSSDDEVRLPPPKKKRATRRKTFQSHDEEDEPATRRKSYKNLSKEALQEACSSKGLDTSGIRSTLIARLETFDHMMSHPQPVNQGNQQPGVQRENNSDMNEVLIDNTSSANQSNKRSRRKRKHKKSNRRRKSNRKDITQLRRHVEELQNFITTSVFQQSTHQQQTQNVTEAPPAAYNNPSTSFSGSRSISAPGIPQQQLDQIKRGDFVNFNLLLPQPASASNSTQSFTVSVSEDNPGSFSISGAGDSSHKLSKGKVKVSSPQLWFLAWSLFLGAMMMFHEHLVPALIRYQERICRYFTTYTFQSVADYDVQFRRKLAVNPVENSWDRVDLDVFSATLKPQASSTFSPAASGSSRRVNFSEVTCYKCGLKGHFANRCPTLFSQHSQTQASGSSHTQSRPTKPPLSGANVQVPFQRKANEASAEACPLFNSSYCKYGSNCRYVHKCSFCGKSGHPAHSCLASRSSG